MTVGNTGESACIGSSTTWFSTFMWNSVWNSIYLQQCFVC